MTSLEQEKLELDSKMEHMRVSMDAAKLGKQNAQTYLSRLQQAEFRVKQVLCIMVRVILVEGYNILRQNNSRALTLF